MDRKKVLLLVTLSETGGAQKVVYHLAAGLDREKFGVTVACAPGGDLVRWVRGLGDVEVVELPSLRREVSPAADLLCLFRLYRLIRSGGYDIVHCHSSKAGVLGRLAARLAGAPRIFFTVHGWGINDYQGLPARFFYKWAERLAGFVCTGVVCVSRYDLYYGRSLKLVPEEKLSVIYNGLPASGKRTGLLRGELNLKDGDIIVGTVARLAYQKNPQFFLALAERMLARHRDTGDKGRLFFVVIGDGPLKGECEELLKSKGLGGRVFLLGARDSAGELVHDFDIFVLFSRWEGLPLTVIEAMTAGVPVVAGNAGGVGEMVAHGETGYLVEGFDLDAAAGYVQELAGNPGLRARMGAAGRRRALELFGLERMIRRYEKLYLDQL
ncbi:MAG: glycosyltransferase family 4 protein [Peptococcaceae bacterium]|nr:glycosyltransferase family 4 protein [Peptococcaceae bacterium]